MTYISESKGKVQRAVHLHSQSDHPLGISSPYGLTTNSEGHIIVVEERAHCISVFTPEGMKIRLFQSNGSANSQFYGTTGIAVDNIYVVDNSNHCLPPLVNSLLQLAQKGTNPLQFYHPVGISFKKKNGKQWIILII